MGPLKREIPWCTILLVVLATTCHVIVLIGNQKTATALEEIGGSTTGWSGVGLELSDSLHNELDVLMANLTAGLTACINATLVTQGLLDAVVAQIGSATESLLQSNAMEAVVLLQEHVGSDLSGANDAERAVALHGLQSIKTKAVDDMADKATEQVIDALNELMDELTPALEQVGDFITKFGDKIQAVIEGFSVTLDRVQKLFDQIMARLASGASEASEEQLEYETFTLYDVDNSGNIKVEDLKSVAQLYGVTALKGTKPEDLLPKYDTDGDGMLDRDEYHRFVLDPSIPNVMSYVLRTYSKRLAEIAGNVAAAKYRDEVAFSVTNYLLLVCAKNRTKVGWVSEALTNGSLPLEFTADVMVQLALSVDDPNVLTTIDTGALVISTMLELNEANTKSAYSLLSNETFWITEGFDPDDQGICLKRVTEWMKQDDKAKLLEISETQQLQEKKMKAALALRRRKRDRVYDQLFESKTAKALQLHLLSGTAAATTNGAAERVINSGVPAKPETLEFAQFLSWNASNTASRFQALCFDNSQTSSNAVDSFGTQIASMVNKIKGFINLLEPYSTPAGIALLKDKVSDFAENAAKDLKMAVKEDHKSFFDEFKDFAYDVAKTAVNKVEDTLEGNSDLQIKTKLDLPAGRMLPDLPALKTDSRTGARLQELLGKNISQMSSRELEALLADHTSLAMTDALSKASHHVNGLLGQLPASRRPLPQLLIPTLSKKTVVLTSDGEINDLVSVAPHSVRNSLRDATEIKLVETAADLALSEDFAAGVWDEMAALLTSLSNLLPQATNTLKLARREVSMLSSNLDSIFVVFQAKGSPIFDNVAELWSLVWTLYFCFIIPMSLILLLYAFWAGGYLGGAGNKEPEEAPTLEPPPEEKTCWWRMKTCCASCCTCFTHTCHNFHDYELCFWSCIILMQVICLVMFTVTILLCILAGVKVFLANGCAQIYVLGDDTICGQTLANLKEFLNTFLGELPFDVMPSICTKQGLLTCQLISSKMKASGVMTTIGSFFAVFFSSQFLIESSILHTRAVWRRKIAKMEMELR